MPPVAAMNNGLPGKSKIGARSLKRKRAVEDYERLQNEVEQLVCEHLRWGRMIANSSKGHQGIRN